ncbi:hypothetical protein F7D08_1329 [Bifidobacterium cebidarum]|uniref:Uncharacterized protein n=1 Tax=Bifidobacterium cebidarum TaxID=2650773 RepID=A0A6I1GF80_9BIFI|nr:hypothetical protein F7D08_1329 [Bifidobacterium cebidarum]
MARASSPYRHLLGLAPDEACHAATCYQRPGGLLHRRFTLTHLRGRSILCCAISQVTLGGRYPPSCSAEPGSSSADPNEDHGRGHQEVSSRQLYIWSGEDRTNVAIRQLLHEELTGYALCALLQPKSDADVLDDPTLPSCVPRGAPIPMPLPQTHRFARLRSQLG